MTLAQLHYLIVDPDAMPKPQAPRGKKLSGLAALTAGKGMR